MSKTEEEIKRDIEFNKELKKRKEYKESLRTDIELLRLEDEHLRLQKNIFENRRFFANINQAKMEYEVATFHKIPYEEFKKLDAATMEQKFKEYDEFAQELEREKSKVADTTSPEEQRENMKLERPLEDIPEEVGQVNDPADEVTGEDTKESGESS